MTARDDTRIRRSSAVALLILSFTSGAADAFAFLLLKETFTANMTGNLALVGMFTREHYLSSLSGGAVAVGAYSLILWAGLRATLPHAADPSGRSLRLLVLAALLQAGAAVLWLSSDAEVPAVRLGVIGCSAGALALQSVAAKLLSGRFGITTTFITGMLTGLVQDMADKRPGGRLLRVGALCALVAGAVADTAVIRGFLPLAPVLPVVGVALALGLLVVFRDPAPPRHRDRAGAPTGPGTPTAQDAAPEGRRVP